MSKYIFPAIKSEIAFYTPSNFYITLNKISEAEFLKINDNPFDLNVSKKSSIIKHEVRHYVDHVSTLWGQKLNLKHAKAINFYIDKKYLEYSNIIDYIQESKRVFYNIYYTEIYDNVSLKKGEKPWLYKLVLAHKFDNLGNSNPKSPFIMCRFSRNNFQETPIARVPLSIVSLLETNSTYEEITYRISVVNNLPADSFIVENSLLNDEIIYKLIYNQELSIYNVAVHIAANTFQIVEITEALKISSIFATLALNFPQEKLKSFKVDPEKYPTWKDSLNSLTESFDYGFIFLNLLYNYKDEFKKTKKIDLDKILELSNLGTYSSFVEENIKERNKILEEIQSYNINNIFYDQLTNGNILFNDLGIAFEKMDIAESLVKNNIKPKFIFKDTDFPLIDVEKSTFNKDDISYEEWFSISMYLEDLMNNFYEIRGL